MPGAKLAINGLGRIGRAALEISLETRELALVAVNDIGAPDAIATGPEGPRGAVRLAAVHPRSPVHLERRCRWTGS